MGKSQWCVSFFVGYRFERTEVKQSFEIVISLHDF